LQDLEDGLGVEVVALSAADDRALPQYSRLVV
jgi:hypothetical protein